MTNSNRSEWMRLFDLMKPRRARYLFGLLGCSLVGSCVPIVMPLVVKYVLDAIADNSMSKLWTTCLQFTGVIAVLCGLTLVFQYAFGKTVKLIMSELRLRLFERMEKLPAGYYERTHSGDSISRINHDIGVAENAFSGNLRSILSLIMTGGYAAAVMFWHDWRIASAMLLMGLASAYVNARFAKPLRSIGTDIQKNAGKQQERLTDLIAGTQVSRIFQMTDRMSGKYSEINRLVTGLSVSRAKKFASLNGINYLLMWINNSGVFIVGSLMLINGQITLGTLLSLILLLEQVTNLFRSLGNQWANLQASLAGAARVCELLDMAEEPEKYPEAGAVEADGMSAAGPHGSEAVEADRAEAAEAAGSADPRRAAAVDSAVPDGPERPDAFEAAGSAGPERMEAGASAGNSPAKGMVELCNGAFGYTEGEYTLQGLNIAAEEGQVVALVGPSGGGKSTLIKLLLGFYPLRQGELRIEGKRSADYTLSEWRDKMAYVSQDAYLFDGTIEENIRYGRMDAAFEEIVAAARAANAHEFIMEQPDGYGSRVGERGARLSGGQKQRITIARAILKNAPILLLDEATSALDSESEQAVQQGLQQLMKGRTTIAIAHRLSTIRQADAIYVIDKGRIAEKGTHDELIAAGGIYKRLHAIQERNSGHRVEVC